MVTTTTDGPAPPPRGWTAREWAIAQSTLRKVLHFHHLHGCGSGQMERARADALGRCLALLALARAVELGDEPTLSTLDRLARGSRLVPDETDWTDRAPEEERLSV